MGVRFDTLDGLGLPNLAAPDLDPPEVEALVAGKSVDHGCALPMKRQVVRLVGDRETGVVRDVLAQGELAVDLESGYGLVGIVLRDQGLGLRREPRMVLRREPVPQIAVCVVLAALFALFELWPRVYVLPEPESPIISQRIEELTAHYSAYPDLETNVATALMRDQIQWAANRIADNQKKNHRKSALLEWSFWFTGAAVVINLLTVFLSVKTIF